MNFLQFFLAVSGVVIFILALDVSKRQKFNALHFLVFLGIGAGLLLFTFVPSTLDFIGKVFGLTRGADALVYGSIVFLLYFALLLLNKVEGATEDVTRVVRELALHTGFQPKERKAASPKISAPSKANVGFLIRSYNEASRLPQVLDGVLEAGYPNILVVDDGSRDSTPSILADRAEIMSVRHFRNRGGGAALETGLEFYRRNADALGIAYVVTFDADGQHHVTDLPNFFKAFKDDPSLDIILGSRFVTKTDSNVPPFRKIILMGGRLFTKMISGITLTDSHNGYRMLRMSTVKKVRLHMDGMEYASELIEQVRIHSLKFAEVPVNVTYDEYTLGKGQKSSNAVNIAMKMIWSKFFR